MGEIHGINDAIKVSASALDDNMQSVQVSDKNGRVQIILGACNYPAGLTPEQARFIARQLIEAARRVEKAADHTKTFDRVLDTK